MRPAHVRSASPAFFQRRFLMKNGMKKAACCTGRETRFVKGGFASTTCVFSVALFCFVDDDDDLGPIRTTATRRPILLECGRPCGHVFAPKNFGCTFSFMDGQRHPDRFYSVIRFFLFLQATYIFRLISSCTVNLISLAHFLDTLTSFLTRCGNCLFFFLPTKISRTLVRCWMLFN